jgi:hypothetical protein
VGSRAGLVYALCLGLAGCAFAGTRGGGDTGTAGAAGGSSSPGGAGTTGVSAGTAGSPFNFYPDGGMAGQSGAAGTGTTGAAGTSMVCLGDGVDQNCMRACGLDSFPVNKVPAEILIIFDRSVSMLDPATGGSCGNPTPCGSKWMEMTSAIEKVVTQTDTTVDWGLQFFAETNSACGVAAAPEVGVAPGNGAAITAALTAAAPGGHTPTRLAVQAGTAYLKARTTPNPKYILLATDGIPNCIPGTKSQTAYDMAGSTAAVASALAMGIPTFVLGVGTGGSSMDAMVFDPTLTSLAMAGGKPRAGTPNYYHVSSSADVVAALSSIQGQANSCVFNLRQVPPDPSNIAVRGSNNTRIPQDPTHAEGWDYGPGMKSVQLYGSYCAHVVDGTLTDIQAIFGCPSQIIP